MSREDLEVVQAVFDAVARRDTEAVLSLYDADVEWDHQRGPFGHIIGQGVYHGHDGLRSWFGEFYEAWADVEFKCERLIEAGDYVISVTAGGARGRASGAWVEWSKPAGVWTVHDGKIVRVVWYLTLDEAIESSGGTPPAESLVELARQAMDAITRRDLEFLVAHTDPEVEWHSFFAELGEGGIYSGHDGLKRYVSDLHEAWEIVRPDVDDSLEVGNVAVLVGRVHYRGKASGVETDQPAGWIFTFRSGRVLSFRAFRDPEQVLGASDRRA